MRKRYVNIKTRLNVYKLRCAQAEVENGVLDFEIPRGYTRKQYVTELKKTVGVIEALINRADVLSKNAEPGGKFYPSAHGMMDWAEEYVSRLEKGILPFHGLYTEPGMSMSDHSLIEKDGRMHMFYNRVTTGYAWWEISVDSIGHAVSDDLIHWEVEPIAIATDPSRFDNSQTWSPAVVKKGDTYYMFYTGCNEMIAQAPCLAKSKDLYVWENVASPLFTPGEWCPWDPSHWSNGRDSMVFADDDGSYYMYYCSSRGTLEKNEDVIGLASSKDLINWKDEGCTRELYTEMASESPYVLKRDGKYYMFFTDCYRAGTGYAVSDNPLRGWKIKPGDEHMIITINNCRKENLELDGAICASEVFEFKGKWYISYVHWLNAELLGFIGFKELFWEKDGFRFGKDLQEI